MNQIFDGESLITREAIAAELASAVKPARPDEQFEIARAELALALSLAHQRFESGADPANTVNSLSQNLYQIRRRVSFVAWQELIPQAQGHAVSRYLLQDPFTRWSYEKPRGYSGDAHLWISSTATRVCATEIDDASPLGRALYDVSSTAFSSTAVKERRDILASQVDSIAASRGADAEILTIAAGHLREAERSVALRERRLKRWVALDQDPLSVGSIARDFQGTSVEAIDGSVRGLMGNRYHLGHFDLIYAAGLYDYLTHSVAIKLTRRCMKMLKPNGVFLFANFSEELIDDGYMETFMDWSLLLRSETDMWEVINGSVDRNTVDASVEFGANRNIVYGIIRKND